MTEPVSAVPSVGLCTLGSAQLDASSSKDETHAIRQVDGRALLAHELRRARYLSEPFALIAIRHDAALPLDWLVAALRPIDVAYAYAPNVTLVYLVRARRAEAESFATDLLRGCESSTRVGAVLSATSLSEEEIIERSLAAACARKPERSVSPKSLRNDPEMRRWFALPA
ncbi:MAG TPA: hypothetical protein VFX59_18220 [Polyangiales bacterium]|nr:hypothetical protein [Polyangiales bacterium]